jgi:alpha-beta hydrolase superfamily lysophospholipase
MSTDESTSLSSSGSRRSSVVGRPDQAWSADTLLPGFEARTLHFPEDYDGPVQATLVRRMASTPTTRAVLYVHGFIDYFFQAHLAEEFNSHSYNFYALDLRKYGRSMGGARHPNYCRDIREYYPEITAAIGVISEEDGNDFMVLNGHSTGGLITSLYAAEGSRRDEIKALVLNSPFFDFNVAPSVKAVSGIIAGLGALAPFASISGGVSDLYPKSIHKDYNGEWDFDLILKPVKGFPAYLGWLRAIRSAHSRVRRGLAISCPVLVLHSDKSVYGKEWSEDFHEGDAVLNVAHIREGGRHLGPKVTEVEIKGGLHDLTLSRKDVREHAFAEMFDWLEQIQGTD